MQIEARLFQLKNEKLIDIIREFHNISIQVGIECGYNEGLKRINKGITREQIIESSKIFYEKGIANKIFYSFIIGFPWETVVDIEKTIDLMWYIKNEYGIDINCSWWIPVLSKEFEYLKGIRHSIDNSIFNKNGWVSDGRLFYEMHPNINELEFFKITIRMLDLRLCIQ